MTVILTFFSLIFLLLAIKILPIANTNLNLELVKSFLPQTACTDCGYEDCTAYAKALVQGEKINLCSMGGTNTFNQLRDYFSYRQSLGGVNNISKVEIIEDKCIGCTRCIKACPVNAIVGSAKLMHSVIEDICNGCSLCLDVCPTDCIVEKEKSIKVKPSAKLACIACGKCNSVQNPHMDKVFHLVEAGDGNGLAKLNLNNKENKNILNACCPVGIPVFDYLTYAIYLAESAKTQVQKAQKNLDFQSQKTKQSLKPKPKFIRALNIDIPATDNKSLFTEVKVQNSDNTPINKDQNTDIQAKLAALKAKVKSSENANIEQKLEQNMLATKQHNTNIARNVAVDNLKHANKVLNNLLKASDSTAERIKQQRVLVKQAKEQLEQIERELIHE